MVSIPIPFPPPLSTTNSVSRQFKDFLVNPSCNLYPLFLSLSSSSSSSSSSYPVISSKRCSWCTARAKKKTPPSEPILKPSIVDEVIEDDDDGDYEDSFDDDIDDIEDFDDEGLIEDDVFLDDYEDAEAEPIVGDGSGGGGISLAGTTWDKEALAIAEEVSLSFDGELGIYAFKTLRNSIIQVRIERLTNKSGSPSMEDIEAFSSAYTERLEAAGSIPEDISVEVSSPGLERVVRIPQDLDRFKDRNMFVKYVLEAADTNSSSQHDGVFRLVSFDLEQKRCTWGVADVKVNREKAGKGRPLNKKQREWRLNTPFESLLSVRIHADF